MPRVTARHHHATTTRFTFRMSFIHPLRLGTMLPKSVKSWSMLEKGESRIMHDTSESFRFSYNSAVDAPIERPQRIMWSTWPVERRCATTAERSAFSRWPSVTNSPSLRPEPQKSNAKTLAPVPRQKESIEVATTREDELPCSMM